MVARLFHMQKIARFESEDRYQITGDTMKQLIQVNQDDITHGTRGSCSMCPIARALYRTLPGTTACPNDFRVQDDYCWMNGSTLDLSRSARRFINRFDSGKPVKPFRFYLETE